MKVTVNTDQHKESCVAVLVPHSFLDMFLGCTIMFIHDTKECIDVCFSLFTTDSESILRELFLIQNFATKMAIIHQAV